MELVTEVGGRPGIDCGGFCGFCFYKKVDFKHLEQIRLGCVRCPPNQIGCNHCNLLVNRVIVGFKPLPEVLMDVENRLAVYYHMGSNLDDVKILVRGGADVSSYPQIVELVTILKNSGYPLHLGYTSGKGIKNKNFATELIAQGLDEVSFSVFSTNPAVRREWVRDKNPVEAIESLKLFCENIDVNASIVVVPGVNGEKQILQTASDLEEWGVKTLTLRRFANFKNQGLIFNDNRPVIEGVSTQTYSEFKELVKKVEDEFSFDIFSFPFYSSKNDFPFAILKEKNRNLVDSLPPIKSEATVITGKLAGPYIQEFFNYFDEFGLVNVVVLEKEIADLITHEDLEIIQLDEVKQHVIIPYEALVHDNNAEKILSRDGISRKIIRGPSALTHPYYEGVSFSGDEILRYELESFKNLIDNINDV